MTFNEILHEYNVTKCSFLWDFSASSHETFKHVYMLKLDCLVIPGADFWMEEVLSNAIAIFLKIFDHQIHKLSIVCGESSLIIIRLNMIYIGFLIKTLKCLFFNWNTLEHGLKMVSRWRSINLVLNEATVVGLWKFPKHTSPTTTKPGSDVEQRVHFLVPMRWSPTWCASGRSCPISNSIWALELVCHTYEFDDLLHQVWVFHYDHQECYYILLLSEVP